MNAGKNRLGIALGSIAAGLVLLAACNTSSVSGTQQKPSNTTAAETKAASSPGAGRQAQGAIGAALANTR